MSGTKGPADSPRLRSGSGPSSLAFAGGSAQGGSQVQQIGYGVVFGVVMDTLVVRTILVPALVTRLGRWNWWPSKLWRRDTAITEEPAA